MAGTCTPTCGLNDSHDSLQGPVMLIAGVAELFLVEAHCDLDCFLTTIYEDVYEALYHLFHVFFLQSRDIMAIISNLLVSVINASMSIGSQCSQYIEGFFCAMADAVYPIFVFPVVVLGFRYLLHPLMRIIIYLGHELSNCIDSSLLSLLSSILVGWICSVVCGSKRDHLSSINWTITSINMIEYVTNYEAHLLFVKRMVDGWISKGTTVVVCTFGGGQSNVGINPGHFRRGEKKKRGSFKKMMLRMLRKSTKMDLDKHVPLLFSAGCKALILTFIKILWASFVMGYFPCHLFYAKVILLIPICVIQVLSYSKHDIVADIFDRVSLFLTGLSQDISIFVVSLLLYDKKRTKYCLENMKRSIAIFLSLILALTMESGRSLYSYNIAGA